MTTTLLPTRLLQRLQRALDTLEEALRRDDRDEADTQTTREILLPSATDEPPARRAERQAHDYLERRRRKLARQLDDPPATR